MRAVTIAVVGLLIVACGDDKVDGTVGGACADISGNWQVTSTRLDGNCPAELDGDGKSTQTFSRAGNGWALVFPGVQDGCPAALDTATCKLTASCELSRDGALIATVSFDYTFANGTFSGTTSNAAGPPLSPSPCTATYRDTGSKL